MSSKCGAGKKGWQNVGEPGSEVPRASSPWPGGPPSGTDDLAVTGGEGCGPHFHSKVTGPALRLRAS